jgi:hypothetical protein|tara:strand:- start:1830 stop:2756 length:927 start_codon:yes stop_codon:yes gene_type:complete
MTLDAAEIDRAYQFFLDRTPPADKRPPFTSTAQLYAALIDSREFKASKRSWKNDMKWPLGGVFVLPQTRMLCCAIPGSGGDALAAQMVRLSGHPDSDYILRDVNLLTGHVNTGLRLGDHPKAQARAYADAPDFMRLAVLRTPRDRLLAVWRDQFLRNRHLSQYHAATGPVLAAIQGQDRPDFHRSVSFADFVRHVAAAKPGTLAPDWRPQHLFLRGMTYTHLFNYDRRDAALAAMTDWAGSRLPPPDIGTNPPRSGIDIPGAQAMEPPVLDALPEVNAHCFFDDTVDALIAQSFAHDIKLLEKASCPD